MYTEHTCDDYLRDQELLADLASAFGYCEEGDETLERCPMCGDYYPVEDFDGYKGQRMCPDCVELEWINDAAESLRSDFDELFDEMGQAV
ncbi:MAG: hypothetical protein LBG19_09275 [Prevotellaceae bacterium]|jgi:hypothetical protein|nr:hypothetical protein [Prevotellaceae bacterium]